MHVLLDLSTYRNLLWMHCVGPTQDWADFVGWVGRRVNTISRRTYSTDPAIAMVAVAGEASAPGIHSYVGARGQTCRTTFDSADLTAFYHRTLAQLRSAMPNHVIESGGLLNIDTDNGIDWRSIMADANNQVCAIHVYSSTDASVTLPNVANYCAQIRKPWIVEEFGFTQALGDPERAEAFQGRY